MRTERSTELALLLAGLGIGAALMYFLDPNRGARRRSLVRDQTLRASRVAGRQLSQTAHDVKNRARGQIAELRGRFGEDQIDDDQLVARVRAALGHHVERTRGIEVSAADGIVTLHGQVPGEGIDDVVATVRSVRGVKQVNNELTLRALADTESTLL